MAADGVKSPAQAAFRGHDREPAQALLKPVSQYRILPGTLPGTQLDQAIYETVQPAWNIAHKRRGQATTVNAASVARSRKPGRTGESRRGAVPPREPDGQKHSPQLGMSPPD